MTEQIFPRIKAYMISQSFLVNDSWLRECIEYFFSQNQQLLKLYDISVSKYKQLEKLRNVSNVNIEATNENNTQQWEPVGKRMLQLFLTDGIQEILAIEYKPIRILNDSLLPGLKVMIMGPVICRKGVILLEETNIAIREGEVSDLLVPNALENVLANALNLPLNDDPYNDSKKKEVATTIPMDFADDFNIDFDEIGRSVEMAVSRVENNSNKNSSSSSTLSRIENNSNKNSSSSSSSSTLSRIENNSNRNSSSSSSSSTLSRIENNSNKPSSLPPPPPAINQNQNICEFPDDDDLMFEDFEIDEGISSNSEVNTNKTSTAPSTSEFKSSTSNSINFPDDDFDLNDVDFDAGFTWTEPAQVDKKKSTNTNTNSKKETVNFEQGQRSEDNISKQIVTNCSEKKQIVTGSKRSSAELSPVNTAAKIHCLQSVTPMQKPTSNRKITDFIGGNNNKKKHDECPSKVCDFISEILSVNLTNNPIRKSVKAKVTAIGKITKKDEMWILNGTILDQTGKLNVDFSSQFMENLLGLSVSEFNQMKKKSKTDPKLLESMKTLLLEGQKKLGELNSLIELELKKDAKPIVLSSKELSENQIIAHNKRFKFL
ncbi:recQ-mediated genome instability protein 1-like isoform X2 [Leptopilina heterotoma]|uniref:recQ-mediated genome instability protein 1-like isoform X2 n=1 Tax=Leptopilina heterotoma TaxID=63436 RepID=UPI001CA84022|nr:recQ-mediated genome instability protein 1-like isoform X2 [Leptopilina heterotoma]